MHHNFLFPLAAGIIRSAFGSLAKSRKQPQLQPQDKQGGKHIKKMKLQFLLIASIAVAVARGESVPSSLRKRELVWGANDSGTFYTLIAATDYSAMQGVEVQQSSEGITNVGFIDTGDWVSYPVNLPTNGPYQFHSRISSPSGEGSFEVVNFDTQQVYATFSGFPATGDYQAFTTVDQTFDLPAGAFSLQVRATQSGFNMLWFSLKAVAPAPVEAPIDVPVEVPVEAPVEAPVEVPVEAPVEPPVESPVEPPVEPPVEFPETVVTPAPTATRTASPTVKQTPSPTSTPTMKKTAAPTSAPTVTKTAAPTSAPTVKQTAAPTSSPTVKQTPSPTSTPTVKQTPAPSAAPLPPFFSLMAASGYAEMEDLALETSSEGLPNLANFDAGDWATYDISLPYAGTYQMMFRVSSPFGEGGFDITNWDTQEIYSNIDVMPNTGDWQFYQTVSVLVNLPEGGMRMQLKCYNPGFNLLWFVIKSP
jgi:hypothetical protein